MPPRSAGILMYRRKQGRTEVLLVHPGGPYWKNKDNGSWSIPKGEYTLEEYPLDAAKREFEEELGFIPQHGNLIELGEIRLKSGKRVYAWAIEGDCDPSAVSSNNFEIIWPPGSNTKKKFPEIDRAAWFDLGTARIKINPAQINFIDALENTLARTGSGRM